VNLNAARGVSNWETFTPDLIVGITTGVVVGLILFFAQRISQNRDDRLRSQFAWNSIKPKLSGAAHRQWQMDYHDLLPIPAALSLLNEIIADQPIALWRSHIKAEEKGLDGLIAIPRIRDLFQSAAEEVESALDFVGIQIADRARLPLDVLKMVVRSRAYGFEDSEVFLTVTRINEAEKLRVKAAADKMMAVPRLKIALERYDDAVGVYTEMVHLLRADLNPA